MGEPREIAVGAGRIDDHEIVGLLDRADRLGKTGELDRLVLVELEREPRATQKCIGTLRSNAARRAQARRFSI